MLSKNLVPEIWVKRLSANQIAVFLKDPEQINEIAWFFAFDTSSKK